MAMATCQAASMFRSGRTRHLGHALVRQKPSSLCKFSSKTPTNLRNNTSARSFVLRSDRSLGLTAYKPAFLSLVRHQSTISKNEAQHEHDLAERKIKPHPELVSASSSLPAQPTPPRGEDDEPWGAGIAAELKVVKETFTLAEVPRDALYLGLAGVLPYLATSLSTVYLAYDLNHAKIHGFGVFLDADAATFGLQIVEPIQLGYGAVIISFLGAIHWGMEWAGYQGNYPRERYLVGVIAPAVAWPTLLLPVETGLITQFLAFTYLYFNDANATTKGIAPPWYGIYRFVLTFIVGASIVLSLIGRGQVAEYLSHPERPTDVVAQYNARKEELLLQEQKEMAERVASEEEEEVDEEAEEGDGEDDEE